MFLITHAKEDENHAQLEKSNFKDSICHLNRIEYEKCPFEKKNKN